MRTPVPQWLIGGLLYGLSWPIFEGVNLSFLAWFAFVPLFLHVEKNGHSFWQAMLGGYAAMLVFGACTGSWLFHFPQGKGLIAVVTLLELFYIFLPFIPLFILHRRMGFQRAIWLFPLLWTVWEWTYLHLDFTMGTHLSAYSQSSNTWLIQYLDLTGMWGLSFWLMLFNVLLYKAYVASARQLFSAQFAKRMARVALPMLALPLLYGQVAHARYVATPGEWLDVALVPTNFTAAELNTPSLGTFIVENTLHRTDSLAFSRRATDLPAADLYVWPETGLNYQMGYSNLSTLLQDAVNDWDGALLTGCKGVPAHYDSTDLRTYVSGALLAPNAPTSYHHKTRLTPGQEAIPYHHWLAQLPGFPVPATDPRFFRRGASAQPLQLTTRRGKSFQVGVSLCFEQWYPNQWAALAKNGADFFVHLAGEGWYGTVGFQRFMACAASKTGIPPPAPPT